MNDNYGKTSGVYSDFRHIHMKNGTGLAGSNLPVTRRDWTPSDQSGAPRRSEMFVMTGETIIKIKSVPEAVPSTALKSGIYADEEIPPLKSSVKSGICVDEEISSSKPLVMSGIRANERMAPWREGRSDLKETRNVSAVDALFARVSPEHQLYSMQHSPASSLSAVDELFISVEPLVVARPPYGAHVSNGSERSSPVHATHFSSRPTNHSDGEAVMHYDLCMRSNGNLKESYGNLAGSKNSLAGSSSRAVGSTDKLTETTCNMAGTTACMTESNGHAVGSPSKPMLLTSADDKYESPSIQSSDSQKKTSPLSNNGFYALPPQFDGQYSTPSRVADRRTVFPPPCHDRQPPAPPPRDDRQPEAPPPQFELLGCRRFADVPVALDIPPDDISSDDERLAADPEGMNFDLPPPPADLLVPAAWSNQKRDERGAIRADSSDAVYQDRFMRREEVEASSDVSRFSQSPGIYRDPFGAFPSHSSSVGLPGKDYSEAGIILNRLSTNTPAASSTEAPESAPGGPASTGRHAAGVVTGPVLSSAERYESRVCAGVDRYASIEDVHCRLDLNETANASVTPSQGMQDKRSPGMQATSGSTDGATCVNEALVSAAKSPVTEDAIGRNGIGSQTSIPSASPAKNEKHLSQRIASTPTQSLQTTPKAASTGGESVYTGPRLVPARLDLDEDSLEAGGGREADRPSALRLARRLYNLDGFQRADVSKHLCKNNAYSSMVCEEYVRQFDLGTQSLDAALRLFLARLVLAGETQERERVLAHFSRHYLHCNPGSVGSDDACHTLTCALMLLNTDLHGKNVGRRMTEKDFTENLSGLNDGANFDPALLRSLYQSIRSEPLPLHVERLESPQSPLQESLVRQPLGSNPFLNVPDLSQTTEYKKGFVMRKSCLGPDGRKTPLGRRGWKMVHAALHDMVLYMHKDEHGLLAHGSARMQGANSAIRVHHALATVAHDYHKRQHVLRLHTADWAVWLIQTSDPGECAGWVEALNLVAARLSAPPLASAVGSQRKFQRPLMPSSYSKLPLPEQLLGQRATVTQLERELAAHALSVPDKRARARVVEEYREKEAYLQHEILRFKTYCQLLETRLVNDLTSTDLTLDLSKEKVELADPLLRQPAPSEGEGSPRPHSSSVIQRSVSDRYSYRAAIFPPQSLQRDGEA